jgi:hypothetical protein
MRVELVTIEELGQRNWQAILWGSRDGRAVRLAVGVGVSDQAALQNAKASLGRCR